MSVASTFLLNSDAFATNSAAFALVSSVLSAVFVESVYVFVGMRFCF